MKILFDQGTPVPLRQGLPAHQTDTAYEQGWETLENGALLTAAEQEGYQVLVTTDQNLRYQQNLTTRSIAIVVLGSTSWPKIRNHVERIRNAIDMAKAGTFTEIEIT